MYVQFHLGHPLDLKFWAWHNRCLGFIICFAYFCSSSLFTRYLLYYYYYYYCCVGNLYGLTICFQVHHGGAGTTAAGLRAAVITSKLVAMFDTFHFLLPHYFIYLITDPHYYLHHSALLPLFLSLGTNHSGGIEYMLEE